MTLTSGGSHGGVIQPRVKDVGPEHFGIVSIDCAKARSKMMCADFYGRVLVKPTVIEHDRSGFETAMQTLKQAINEHHIKDTIVCVEMTRTYDQIVVRAFRQAQFEVRMVHPFALSHYRDPESGDLKTDDRDLIAIFRAVVNGFGMSQPTKSELDQKFLLLVRHRRDLVSKKSKRQMQIHSYIERCLPGFAALFFAKDFWRRQIALALLRFIAAHG